MKENTKLMTHHIKLFGQNEQIEIIHKALDRKIFATGCVGLVEKIKSTENGFFEWLN